MDEIGIIRPTTYKEAVEAQELDRIDSMSPKQRHNEEINNLIEETEKTESFKKIKKLFSISLNDTDALLFFLVLIQIVEERELVGRKKN